MSATENGLHQQLMDAAYARWQGTGWSKDEFHDSLSPQERFAVHTGNLNYQVGNGGFMQWWDNQYGTPSTVDFLERAMARMGTNTALVVAGLLKRYKEAVGTVNPRKRHIAWEDVRDEMEGLNDEFYKIDDQFLIDCENHLKNGGW